LPEQTDFGLTYVPASRTMTFTQLYNMLLLFYWQDDDDDDDDDDRLVDNYVYQAYDTLDVFHGRVALLVTNGTSCPCQT